MAYLKIISPPTGLTILKMGDNKNIEIGADVHAIGHPKGFIWTYTRGSISQVRPKHKWTIGSQAYKATVVQTHTPINPGTGPNTPASEQLATLPRFGGRGNRQR